MKNNNSKDKQVKGSPSDRSSHKQNTDSIKTENRATPAEEWKSATSHQTSID